MMATVETQNNKYVFLPNLGIAVNKSLIDEVSEYNRSTLPNTEDIINHLRRKISNEEIWENLGKCKALILNTTEQCSLRCRYCVYSGIYPESRVHSNRKMSLKTARKAVDFFLDLLANHRSTNSNDREVFIGFYGGETMLAFDTLKHTVKYAESKIKANRLDEKLKFIFSLTTNGYHLGNTDIQDFVQLHNLRMDVSLDGPQQEHDRFRVTSEGKGTWQRITENLKSLKQRHPDYYEKNVRIMVTLHPHHDGKVIDEFYRKNPDLMHIDKVQFNNVNIANLAPVELKKINRTTGTQSDVMIQQSMDEFEAKFFYRYKAADSDWTGNCFPGSVKLFVDTEGGLNVCEKCSHLHPTMGNVFDGFDFSAIRKMIRKYNEEIIRNKCWECSITSHCGTCSANAIRDDGSIGFNCKEMKVAFAAQLTTCISRMETGNDKTHAENPPTDFVSFMESI